MISGESVPKINAHNLSFGLFFIVKQFHLELLIHVGWVRVIIFSMYRSYNCTHTHTPQDGRMAVADTTLGEVAADVPAIGRVSLRTRKTLRGHLAKIYAMHWASDSR